jgi:antitoxin component YwqK of YwqJK toxin-antitoxin module
MFRLILFFLLIAAGSKSSAQKIEEGYDFNFKPTKNYPFYYVTTEERNGKWYREAFFLPDGYQAMEGWYKDKEGKVADGEMKWFHPNKMLKSTGKYVDGKQEGTWLSYHDNGMLSDSSTYIKGFRIGESRGWDKDGYLTDSTNFDGTGNGFAVFWYTNGQIKRLGSYIQDTSKNKTWNYYYPNGKIKATEEYSNGERKGMVCYDLNGKPGKENECVESEAEFPGGMKGWRNFLEKNLNPNVSVDNGAPVGIFSVYVKFIVNEDGSLSEIQPLTNIGFGMENEVLRLMNESPNWVPAIEFGVPVKAYRIQPVTFQVIDE